MINKRKKKIIIGFTITLGILIVLFMAFYIYTLDYYRADAEASVIFYAAESRENITVFYPEEGKSDTGLIFYPGGKVEASAYSPLLKEISDEGITCILVEMPFNLAVFGVNSADKIYDQFPDIENWYL
ncbi:MAG: carboxymethylenebutenolidase, partial [Clostridia bacterium]|nr:carboxymethylenebutenolidase [Clostridia bacterium]